MNKEIHISERELMMAVDGELNADRAAAIRNHVACCVLCRSRQTELKATMDNFLDAVSGPDESAAFAKERSRVTLRQQLARASEASPLPWLNYAIYFGCIAFSIVLAVAFFQLHPIVKQSAIHSEAALLPNPHLTPGSVRPVTAAQVCAAETPSTSRFIPTSTGQ